MNQKQGLYTLSSVSLFLSLLVLFFFPFFSLAEQNMIVWTTQLQPPLNHLEQA